MVIDDHMNQPESRLVTSVSSNQVRVDNGPAWLPMVTSVWPRPIVGDWVYVSAACDRVTGVADRRNVLRRADPAGGEQEFAANVDVVAIVCGLDRPLKAGRVQRAAALAWDCAATPILVLSKADLLPDPAEVEAQARLENPGVEVLVVSVADGRGIDAMKQRLTDQSVVLLGESGSGKSTLTNALIGRDVARVSAVRSGDHKGRHTTTHRELFELPGGGRLIDTPGIRAIGLPADLELSEDQFADIHELAADCRFSDCRHAGEPKCAVGAAVADGRLPRARLDQWLRLNADLAATQRRSDVHAQRQFERNRTKQIYKPTKAWKRKGL